MEYRATLSRPVTVKSSDDVNKSAETWQAFADEGIDIPTAGPRMLNEGGEVGDGSPATLTPKQIENMLEDRTPWTLLVGTGDTPEALDRATLAAAMESDADTVYLRTLNQNEEQVVAEARTEASGSAGRIRDARALPVASVGLLATVGSGLGLLALKDPARPELLVVALVLGLIALASSLIATWKLRVVRIDLTRLDVMRERRKTLVERGTRSAAITGAIFFIALALVAGSVLPQDDTPTEGTIGAPTVSTAGAQVKLKVQISWTGLGEKTATVISVIEQDGTELATKKTPKGADDTVSDALEVEVTAGTPARVETQPVDADGKPVGTGVLREISDF